MGKYTEENRSCVFTVEEGSYKSIKKKNQNNCGIRMDLEVSVLTCGQVCACVNTNIHIHTGTETDTNVFVFIGLLYMYIYTHTNECILCISVYLYTLCECILAMSTEWAQKQRDPSSKGHNSLSDLDF